MSNWIRIDDDTYIDDSLVTCAEYQLFINEMREQGKYHQPDHWTDYRFAKGQARQPILGMRNSDAVAFCEWLTKHNNNSWTYRLPTASEAQEILISKTYVSPIGYWLSKNAEEDFAWVGPIPKNPLALDITTKDTSSHARALEHVRDSDFELASKLTSAIERASVPDFASNFASARDILINIISGYDIARELNRFIDRARTYSSNIAHARNLDFISTRALYIALDLTNDVKGAQARDILVNLYVDSVAIQSRINGTSPAFEGIRLVKERRR